MKIDWSSSTVQGHAGDLAVDAGDLGPHAFGDLHRVGARLLGDAHPDARRAVDAGELAAILGGVADVGDVAHVDRDAVLGHHRQVADFVDVGELAGAAQQQHARALEDLAERDVLVLGAQDVDDAVDREVERGDLLARQVDADLAAQAAVDAHRGHAGDALEPRRQVVLGHLAQRDRVEVALDADAHDRERGRVELEDGRRVGVLGQAAADAVDAGADLVGGLVEIGAPGEVEAHGAVAFRRGRVDLVEAGDGAHRLLDRPRDQLFHLERPDAGVADPDGDRWEADVRHQVDRQLGQRDGAEQHDDEAQHEHRHRSGDGESRDTHRSSTNATAAAAVVSLRGGHCPGRVSGRLRAPGSAAPGPVVASLR